MGTGISIGFMPSGTLAVAVSEVLLLSSMIVC